MVSFIYKDIRHNDALVYEVFDQYYNVDTSHPRVVRYDGKIAPGIIKNSDKFPSSYGFQNVTLFELDQINAYLQQDPNIGSYKFIDIGSGKARVILHNLATNAPYGSYAGVEIDPDLHTIAKGNLISTNIVLNKYVELINDDALNYTLPNSPCVVFLFHSFSNDTYNSFIDKNIHQINNTGSYLVLVSPQEYDLNRITGKDLVFQETSIYIYK